LGDDLRNPPNRRRRERKRKETNPEHILAGGYLELSAIVNL
jgi:hypothetical protein